MELVNVAGPDDYRLDRLRSAGVYFSPIDPDERGRASRRSGASLLDGGEETGATLEVLGRQLRLPHASGGLLRASLRQPLRRHAGAAGLPGHRRALPHRAA